MLFKDNVPLTIPRRSELFECSSEKFSYDYAESGTSASLIYVTDHLLLEYIMKNILINILNDATSDSLLAIHYSENKHWIEFYKN
ncbi:MAG: hypothetical protein B6U89_07205 [Desulfurococcales archaeon ex4484_58]|nr:MAG: hypothetical protein B6U89_07205 [Desulfurococcales archaeon ex4484_58]